MICGRAVYGEVRGGHGLRAATPGFERVAEDCISGLDLPDTAPAGVDWSPFTRGFPHGEWFVLARTFLDVAAPRKGMVLSHALFAPLTEFSQTSDLRPALALLPAGLDAPVRMDVAVVAGNHCVAQFKGRDARCPSLSRFHAVRTYSGRPRSSMRFSAPTAMDTSVARRRSVRERSPSPITRLKRLTSASTSARQL